MPRHYRLVSADAHTLEPPDMWERYLPKKLHADHLPRVVKDAEGGDAWLVPGGTPAPIGLITTGGQRYEEFNWFGNRYDTMKRGAFDGKARLDEQDEDGVDAEVLFPSGSPRTIGYFAGHEDDAVHEAGIEAYNTWQLEEFAAADPERLIALAMMPQMGIERSVAELRRAKQRGFRGIYLQNFPSGNPKLSPADDPFWAAAEEEGMPINIHLGISGSLRQMPAEARQAMRARFGSGRLPDLVTMGGAIGGFSGVIAEFIYSGLLDRFPGLKLVGVEVGASWVPALLEHMDDHYWRNRTWTDTKLKLLPSEYFRRNWRVTFIREPFAIKVREAVGIKNMMWSTDYPHHRHDAPYSRRLIEDMFFGVPEAEKRAIVCMNAVELYDLPHVPEEV